jgi:hypothetical protein
MRSDEILQGLTADLPNADTVANDLRSSVHEVTDLQSLMQLMLHLHAAILTQSPAIQHILQVRRAKIFAALAPHFSGSPLARTSKLPQRHIHGGPKKTATTPTAVRPPKIKTIEEAEAVIQQLCEEQGLSGPHELLPDWKRLEQLGRVNPSIDDAIMILGR